MLNSTHFLRGPLLLAALAAAFLCTFSSCILINDNQFRTLRAEERKSFQAFSLANASRKMSYADSCIVERVNHKDLAQLSSKYPVIWVHIFAPWCRGTTCENMAQFEQIAQAQPNIKLALISISYHHADLASKLKHSGFTGQVYVIDTGYSNKHDKGMLRFWRALKKTEDQKRIRVASDFVMRNDTVVYVKDGLLPDSVFFSDLARIGRGEPPPPQRWARAK